MLSISNPLLHIINIFFFNKYLFNVTEFICNKTIIVRSFSITYIISFDNIYEGKISVTRHMNKNKQTSYL